MFLLLCFVQVKPVINQINLAVCCVIPPELSEFAKANSIQLLTHSDARGKITLKRSLVWFPVHLTVCTPHLCHHGRSVWTWLINPTQLHLLWNWHLQKWEFPPGFEPGTSRTLNPWSPIARHACDTSWPAFSYPYRPTGDEVVGLRTIFFMLYSEL